MTTSTERTTNEAVLILRLKEEGRKYFNKSSSKMVFGSYGLDSRLNLEAWWFDEAFMEENGMHSVR